MSIDTCKVSHHRPRVVDFRVPSPSSGEPVMFDVSVAGKPLKKLDKIAAVDFGTNKTYLTDGGQENQILCHPISSLGLGLSHRAKDLRRRRPGLGGHQGKDRRWGQGQGQGQFREG